MYLQTATNSCSDIHRPVTSKGLFVIPCCALLSYLIVRICPPSSSCRSGWGSCISGKLSSRVFFKTILCDNVTGRGGLFCLWNEKIESNKMFDGLQHESILATKAVYHLATDEFTTVKALRLHYLNI